MRTNLFFQRSLLCCAVIAASVLLFILYFLIRESAPLINQFGVSTFFTGGWHPLDAEYSLTAMLVGSLFVAFGAVIVAAPLGVAVAVFGQYYAPKVIRRFYNAVIELLAGIPSVVFGFWGLTVLVPLINNWVAPGASVLAGVIVLAMMILPLVVLTADAALSKVPSSYLRSAHALGLSHWGIIQRIALPVAMPGIISGVILQTGRALGETMAILMVTGNVVQLPSSWFEPVRTLTANIALEMSYAVGDHRVALYVSGLLLLLITAVLVLIAHQVKGKRYA